MKEYSVKIEFKSEAILGSGESVPGYIDFDIVYDEYGLPYFKGKTFKGKLREEGENISRLLGEEYPKELVNSLFGYKKDGGESRLYFSDFTVGENIKSIIKNEVIDGNISPKEVLEAMTNVRNFTAIDEEGVAKATSLRKMRVLKKGLILKGKIEVSKELTEKEEEFISLSLGTLKHIGLMGNRGKGEIECTLEGIEKFEKLEPEKVEVEEVEEIEKEVEETKSEVNDKLYKSKIKQKKKGKKKKNKK